VIAELIDWTLWAAIVCFCLWLAIKLCRKVDWKRAMEAVTESGMTVNEYAKQCLTEEFLEKLPKLTYEQMKSALKAEKNNGKITQAQYIILLKLLSWTPGKDEYPKL
jgi:hypothetical protein